MHVLNHMHITANTAKVLEALKANRETHQTIVKEARVGYVKKAREALKDQLAKLESGKVSVVTFHLAAPQDHTKVYDTAIKMMELHSEETVVLDSQQVRTLMMDEWDWKSHFLMSNSMYSETAAAQSGSADDE
jgi:hypothetical protein